MKQSLILVMFIAGCASQPKVPDTAYERMTYACSHSDKATCVAETDRYLRVVEETKKIDAIRNRMYDTANGYDPERESIRLNQRLLDMQLYGVGR